MGFWMTKVNIIWNVKDVPFGGGNQFLKRLKECFINMGCYAEPEDADVFLFNSHHEMDRVQELRRIYPDKKFVHRIDGPMRLYNNSDDSRDDIVLEMNNMADSIVFQSAWSMEHNFELYPILGDKRFGVIHNACDVNVKKEPTGHKKRLIAVSMSDNMNKGYEVYKYLDENLDFDEYDFTFIGRSPIAFKNIVDLGVKTSDEVLDILSKHDIFVTASKNDPCSNSLIEALSVGLPSLALNSGGHTEIVLSGGGVLFSGKHDVLVELDRLSAFYETCEKNINVQSMTKVALKYLAFFEGV